MEEVEKENVAKLRSLVEDIQSDLTYFDLLRWLQGHDYNFDIIVPKLRAHLKFVKAWGFKNYKPHPLVMEYFPRSKLGPSNNDNNLVYLECSGRLDVMGLLKVVPKIEIFKTQMFFMEQYMDMLREQEGRTGKQAKFTLIMDHEHLKFNQSLVNFVTGDYKDMCNILIDHYVESYETIININLPSFLPYLFNLIKVFVPDKTKTKIVLLGGNWRSEILKYVDAGILPQHWGGTLTDGTGDPMCSTIVKIPPMHVPQHLFWTPGQNDFAPEELTVMSVGAGRCETVTVAVTKVGSVLEWYYKADNGFTFSVYFTEVEGVMDRNEMEVVYPDFKFSHAIKVPERDKIECKAVGFYKLRFDNAHSWITTTKVQYKLLCY